jgi:hypothetical protein
MHCVQTATYLDCISRKDNNSRLMHVLSCRMIVLFDQVIFHDSGKTSFRGEGGIQVNGVELFFFY